MPRLMEKEDWVRTVANVGSARHVWSEQVSSRKGASSFMIPEDGSYQVILIKLDDEVLPAATNRRPVQKKSATLFETLRSCPFGGVELEIERDHGPGREIAFG